MATSEDINLAVDNMRLRPAPSSRTPDDGGDRCLSSRSVMRDFIPGDQGLRQLILTGLQHRWGDAYDPRFNGDLEDFESNYIKRGAEIVVIELNHKLVATGTLVPDGSNSGRIVRMSVAGPNRRKGLARRVVSELVARARRQGMSEVRVLTDTPWASAVELYRSCGFVEVASDERETHFTMQL